MQSKTVAQQVIVVGVNKLILKFIEKVGPHKYNQLIFDKKAKVKMIK